MNENNEDSIQSNREVETNSNMDQAIDFLATKMRIDSITTSINGFKIKGVINEPVIKSVVMIKNYFKDAVYVPIFSKENDQHVIVCTIIKKIVDKPKYWLNILLFVATLLSTMFVGAFNAGAEPLKNIGDMIYGIPFSFSIMAILTCHELGHYIVSRKAGMVTSLPYFIPVPFNIIGTLGAIIRMKSIIPSRRDLLNVGMAGPLCGFIISIPITIIGIALSTTQPAIGTAAAIRLGDSLLFSFLVKIMHPNIPSGYDLFLHPIAFAGWIGFLVTSLNLLPIGQLDGGHIAFSIFGSLRKRFYPYLIAVLIGLSLLWPGWIIWGLLAFLTARREPVIQDTITPLTRNERILAIIPLIVLILTFMPQPLQIF